MIPSLVAGEVRTALVDYLATTFSLADDDVRDALADFLTDPRDGVFRGPYLRVRTPFRSVPDSWVPPLGWLPDWFVPYEHQAKAFERLSTAGGREPEPTLVTTGTGSGKTECFLMPALDHCARARDTGERGIKALILYPMNALASDQAGRLAELIATEKRLTGLRAGLYIGENGTHGEMGESHVVDNRHALRADPPDILLTNYKMLDFLLLRSEDKQLWATNAPETLKYVVLDEFHTYDGAQGTDVAMLLRRLGAKLHMAEPGRPLGTAAPVATSATMGSESSAAEELRGFAGKVFGTAFPPESVIGESRKTVDETCPPADSTLPIPHLSDVCELEEDDLNALAAAFCTQAGKPLPANPLELGSVLRSHPVTRAVLNVMAERPRPHHQAAHEVCALLSAWSEESEQHPDRAAIVLSRYLALVSISRDLVGGREVPLFSVEVQLWIREVSRLLRAVQPEPAFRWVDSPAIRPVAAEDSQSDDPESGAVGEPATPEGHDAEGTALKQPPPETELPAVSCRKCGHSGWMATESDLHGVLSYNPAAIYRSAVDRRPNVRALMRANEADPAARWFDPIARRVADTPSEYSVPVHATTGEDDARAQRCPACGERDAVRFVGLAVASLASVTINTLFGSGHVEPEERKLLAFTDSVQDASHRASFFTGRTHRFNLRTLMAGALQEAGEEGTTLAELGETLVAQADTPHGRYELLPPDLLRDAGMRSVWTDQPDPPALTRLGQRTGFEVDLEFGLRSRVGRTLEQSVAAVGWVDLGDPTEVLALVDEAVSDVVGDVPEQTAAGIPGYLLGLAERLRSMGAIHHPFLDPYVQSGGKQWFIWGGRPAGLPPFTPDQSRPTFATTATRGDFDSLTAVSATPTWFLDWAIRSLHLDPPEARAVNERVLSTLAATGDAVVASATDASSTVYGLDRRAVRVVDIAEVDRSPEPATVRCDLCGSAHTVAPAQLDQWVGTPCRRYRCPGHHLPQRSVDSGYYRRYYRLGRTRRVVAGEHTGMLKRRDREELEAAFADGTAPDAPNVLTATPTLEMGIDIGDLSAVMLTSVPRSAASYIQRVGRAGRATGNALVTTFVRSDSHGLYYLAQPEAMLAGAIRPPSCYLEASETLQRQYLAYLMDRMADGDLPAVPTANRIGDLMKGTMDTGGLFRTLIDASEGDTKHVEDFLALFGGELGDDAVQRLREFASVGMEIRLKEAVDQWHTHLKELSRRRDRLRDAIDRLESQGGQTPEDEEELRSLRGQRSAVVALLQAQRNEYPYTALEKLGVLPNYTLVDDSVELTASLWSKREAQGAEDEYVTEDLTFTRPGRLAIKEFAPGNTFYAGGHRHRVDALEIGAANEPLYEFWRICPECTYADIAPEGQEASLCPRCGGAAIADVGARHTVLRLREALASGAEEAARVYDERDDRTREQYDTALLVDIDQVDVRGGWLAEAHTFGAEFVSRARMRTFNLGISDRPGGRIHIAGHERNVARFAVCRHCGAAKDARNDNRGKNPERLHQGWCKVRSGAVAEPAWDPLILVHELTTEAIRFLVPVSMYEVEERLASFKAALKLGIRATLGGHPDHLDVVATDAPNRDGQGRRRFLLLYDQVPGGTGYLAPIADPAHIKRILVAAREHIARCPCRADGVPACHRCLLGVVDRNEYDLVRRDLARGLLDSLLDDWQEPTAVPSVAGVSIAHVEESELERRFKVALREWADRETRAEVTWTPVPGKGQRDAFELTIAFEGEVVRYRITEQERVAKVHTTLPDFRIRRMDAAGPEIAVFLDGRQFHASVENNGIAADATKRAAVRATGALVWNLTWADVDLFHSAVTAEVPKDPPSRILLGPAAMVKAKEIHHRRGDAFGVGALEQNPVALLLDFLVRPSLPEWRSIVLSAVGGLAATGGVKPLDSEGLGLVLGSALAGQWPGEPPAPTGDVVAHAARVITPGGLPVTLVLDASAPNLERWTVFAVLDDSSEAVAAPEHPERWADWLPWANVLQFLGQPHDATAAVIAGTSQAESSAHDDLWLRGLAKSSPSTAERFDVQDAGAALSDDQMEELDLMAPQVADLVRPVLERGAPEVVAGFESDGGTPVEAAWPEARVGVLVEGQDCPAGWTARNHTEWSESELVAALGVS